MNMKKVLDAVSEFKGCISNIPVQGIQGEALIVLCIRDVDEEESGLMYGGSVGFNKDFYCQVCTYKEFDELVLEMSTNFGESSLKHLDIWQQEIKRQNEAGKATKLEVESKVDYTSEEFWKDAPEGALEHAQMEPWVDKLDYWLDSKGYWLAGEYYVFGLDVRDGVNFTRQEFTNITPRPVTKQTQPKPVYTQAMYDKGEFPSVGSMVIIEDTTGDCWSDAAHLVATEVRVMSVFKGLGKDIGGKEIMMVSVSNEGGSSCCFRADMCRPLPPKQELFDGKAYQFDYTDEHLGVIEIVAIYSKGEHKLKSLTRNCHLKDCTNIQHLTVGEK